MKILRTIKDLFIIPGGIPFFIYFMIFQPGEIKAVTGKIKQGKNKLKDFQYSMERQEFKTRFDKKIFVQELIAAAISIPAWILLGIWIF